MPILGCADLEHDSVLFRRPLFVPPFNAASIHSLFMGGCGSAVLNGVGRGPTGVHLTYNFGI